MSHLTQIRHRTMLLPGRAPNLLRAARALTSLTPTSAMDPWINTGKTMKHELSIVIPAYNESAFLSHCLSSIVDTLNEIDYEIIVVDNGSTDSTAAVASQFAGVRVVATGRSTIGRARNIGARIAKSALLAFLDADVVITPEWAAAIKCKLAKASTGADYFGGYPFDIPPNASLLERAWFVASSQCRLTYVCSGNLIVSASLFREMSGFDESLVTAEDVDLGHRVKRRGHTVDFDRELHVIHLGFPQTAGQFLKRERWHGMGSFSRMSSFCHSKVSIAAVLSGILLIMSLTFLATGHGRACLVSMALHLVLPLLYVLYRFRFRNLKYLPLQYALGYLYLAARAASGVSSLLNLSATGHRSS